MATAELHIIPFRERLGSLKAWLPWVGRGTLAVADQALISGSNFVMGILMGRWLPPESYGAYALGFSIFLFLASFQNALILEPMSVFGPTTYSKNLSGYVGRLVRLHFLLAFFLAALVAAGIGVLHYLTNDRSLASALWGVCIAVPLILFFWLCRRASYLRLAPALAARSASVYCLIVILLLVTAHTFRWLSTLTAFLVQSAAALVASALLLVSFRPQIGSQPGLSNSAIIRQHWHYGRWAVGTVFVYWLSGNGYYLIVAAVLQMRDVAALRALQNLTLPFSQFMAAISLLVLPWASARFAEDSRYQFRQRIRVISFVFVGTGSAYIALLWLFGGRLIGILYAGRYSEFAYLLPLVAAPMVLLAFSQGYSIAIQAMQHPSDIFLGYAAAGLATILSGVPLTRRWGLPGAAGGMFVSYLAFFAVVASRCRARLRPA